VWTTGVNPIGPGLRSSLLNSGFGPAETCATSVSHSESLRSLRASLVQMATFEDAKMKRFSFGSAGSAGSIHFPHNHRVQ
jgi:hypothetical protein